MKCMFFSLFIQINGVNALSMMHSQVVSLIQGLEQDIRLIIARKFEDDETLDEGNFIFHTFRTILRKYYCNLELFLTLSGPAFSFVRQARGGGGAQRTGCQKSGLTSTKTN